MRLKKIIIFLWIQLNALDFDEDHEVANAKIDGPRLCVFQDVDVF